MAVSETTGAWTFNRVARTFSLGYTDVMQRDPDIARLIQRAVARTLLVGGAGAVGLACGGNTDEVAGTENNGGRSGSTASAGTEMTSLGGTGGIGGTGGTGTEQSLPPLECPPEGASRFSLMNLGQNYDFLAVRSYTGFSGETFDAANLRELDAFGQCDARCSMTVEALAPSTSSEWSSCTQLCVYNGVAAYSSESNQVQMLETKAQILALLGSIDTAHEAAFWAEVNGDGPGCGPESQLAILGDKYQMVVSELISDCPVQTANVTLEVSPDGSISELSRVVLPETGACIGRRPAGLAALGRSNTGRAVGDYFAEIAQLEQAAVEAFRIIVFELKRLKAPQPLIEQAVTAYLDEIRHTEQTGALARRFGAEPQSAHFVGSTPRELFEFALDNAVEGCVRETFGAAYARHQASTATDFEVRRVLSQIASDEERHASLSWQMHHWALEQLSVEQRDVITQAQHAAVERLREQVNEPVSDEVRRVAGVPSEAMSLAIIDELTRDLWDNALAA